MVKNPIDIKYKLLESINYFLPSIEYVSKRYQDWCYFMNNPKMLLWGKNMGTIRPYYDLNYEFRDILHSVKDIIADVYKSLYFVIEYYAYKRGGKQIGSKLVRTGISALKKEGVIEKNEVDMIGKLVGGRNRIAHDVHYSLQYALNNKYNIQNLLIIFSELIESECLKSDLENFNFIDIYSSRHEYFVEELGKCLNDLVCFDTIAA